MHLLSEVELCGSPINLVDLAFLNPMRYFCELRGNIIKNYQILTGEEALDFVRIQSPGRWRLDPTLDFIEKDIDGDLLLVGPVCVNYAVPKKFPNFLAENGLKDLL